MSTQDAINTATRKLLERAAPGRVAFEDLVVVPLFAILVALILGALTMLAANVDLATIGRSYVALLQGSVGSLNALSETLTAAAPLILAGLGLALGFRAGLFNIGAEGQILIGGMAAVICGFSFPGLPFAILLPLCLIAGGVAGAAYASIAGVLRATTGANEVISTIMLNMIAFRVVDYMLRLPWVQRPGRSDPVSQSVPPSAELPRLLDWIDPNLRVHAGIFVTLLAVAFVYWLLFRSKLGFEFRASGASPSAARYAGMRAGLVIVLAMATAGALAGLAGANQVLGVLGRASPGFSAGIGFDAIAVALLGRSHPVGVLFARLLFGALEAGGRQMQVDAGVSIDLIGIIQALIIVFIAAPLLVRAIFPWGFRRGDSGGAS
ncbi:ABC transporter permease [Roseobacter sp. HKCCD9010]|uniref:ABC transporter permease n=1 Tax=unclassified Roseobacter TaxID=196798 RepID=UPI0014917494|nr:MULTISPECIES: ABC transporter permease [unclassified Roseobacter]MBF9049405.1 ABC transporter permease [Rhodobacterales bacterium HKCCD4356]NNV11405.1 ABC transporter permease [Roseobacter sp. HKCCD7357]NNV15589.1 ABC transporter permease [Roseobacter sp. HKCCD8768]NNV25049.1 ABC transporter permease [Roseobacter sp. HKCCD8192]NNV29306.1 ABC transporter permease [Roseobacter sp. HKCCD9061]